MIKARDFIVIDSHHTSDEFTRLESLNARFDEQPLEARHQLCREFFAIVTNPNEDIQTRILACNMLGGRHNELNLDKPQVVKGLKRILQDEFIVFKRSKYFFRRRELCLRQTDPIKSCFLPILLSTLLRIDFDNTHKIVKKVMDKMGHNQFRETISSLYVKLQPTR